MPHLTRISLRAPATGDVAEQGRSAFPFSLPAVRSLPPLDLDTPVTFFVGENGSGKSTLLEGIAAAADLRALGSSDVGLDDSLRGQRALGDALRLTWRNRTRRGFFLRAEDYFGFLKRRARDDARIERERLEALRGSGAGGAEDAWRDATHADEVNAARYIGQYDAQSHGESFIELFGSQVKGGGLYLLDEPEAPLSPRRQLALIALMAEAVRVDAQFIVATHSPILLAFPGARIYGFDEPPVRELAYAELEHVTLTRDFLRDPERYLRHLRE